MKHTCVSATPPVTPFVDNPLPVLTVESGVYFEFVVPENTFFDFQQGSTRSLQLILLDSNKMVGLPLLIYSSSALTAITLV